MAKLAALTPAHGLVPLTIGEATLSELEPGPIWSISPLKDITGGGAPDLPKPGRSAGAQGAEIVWFSQGQYMAVGYTPDASNMPGAALTDQSDAWCVLELKGPAMEPVLARLVPVDLRQSSFKRGHAMRTMLGHMPLHITRTGNTSVRLMSFRSMAATMVHEIERAMKGVAARG